MISGIPFPTGSAVQRSIFYANAAATNVGWQTYIVPPNATMLNILLLGGGGGGGGGFVGGVNAAGGGGGGCAASIRITVPAAFLPPTLYLSIGYGGAGGAGGVSAGAGAGGSLGIASRISIYPDATANHCLLIANAANGGNAGGNNAGGAGGGGAITSTAPDRPLGGLGIISALAGQNGTSAGITTFPAAYTLTPTIVTNAGTGGGPVPGTGIVGFRGGNYTVPVGNLFFPPNEGGPGAATTTTPGSNGSNGINFVKDLTYFYGGTGGGSTHGSATGAGLVAGNGGAGGYGCGGGGGGAAFTGGQGGAGGKGGDGLAIIYAW